MASSPGKRGGFFPVETRLCRLCQCIYAHPSNISGDEVPLPRYCRVYRARPSHAWATTCVKGGTHPNILTVRGMVCWILQGWHLTDCAGFPHLSLRLESFLCSPGGPLPSPHHQRRLLCLTNPRTVAKF